MPPSAPNRNFARLASEEWSRRSSKEVHSDKAMTKNICFAALLEDCSIPGGPCAQRRIDSIPQRDT